MYRYYLTHLEKYHKAIKIFNIVGAFIILILLLLLIFPNNPVSKYIETSRIGYDKEVCWNKGSGEYWNNSCKGQKISSSDKDFYDLCKPLILIMIPMAENEKLQYSSWVKAGKPIAKGCE